MNRSDLKRNYPMLNGKFAKKGYDWWWHNFTAIDEATGEEKTFFIEYFTCNPKKTEFNKNGAEVVFGQLIENQEKGIQPSYLMVKCGWWGEDATQLHRFIPWNDVDISASKRGGYNIQAFDCYASETILKGKVEVTKEAAESHPEYMCDSGSMEWDIQLHKDIAFNVGYGAGSFFRGLKAFEMYWHAEGMKTYFSGTVTANGKKYDITEDCCFGYSDKNWGADFTSPWVWISSNDLYSTKYDKQLKNSVFDIGGGRPKVFGVALNRQLLSDYWYEGKSYEFNFSKFWTGCKTEFDCQESEKTINWYVRQSTKKYVMETRISCQKKDMLLVNYEAPNGKKLHNRLWNGGTGEGTVKLYKKSGSKKIELIDEVVAKHVGCEYGVYC